MQRNVIFLAADRLRAAALAPYGAAWCETPAANALAAAGFLFDAAFVNSPDLAATYRGYWHGLHPLSPVAAAESLPTLPAVAAARGYATVFLTDDEELAAHPLAADFAECVHVATEPGEGADESNLARFFAAALDVLGELNQPKSPPFFCWLHARALAAPWDAPYSFRAALADEEDPAPPAFTAVPSLRLPENFDPDDLLGIAQAYAGQVSLFDECLGAFLAELPGTGHGETLFALAGTRGFPLGEHGRIGDADEALYGESLHVPLVFRFSDGLGSPYRSQGLVQPADVAATLAGWLDLPDFVAPEGISLLPLVRGEQDAVRDRLVFCGSQGEVGVRTPGWHLRRDGAGGEPELYVKPDDRWEANELASRCGEAAAGLAAALDAELQRLAQLPSPPGEPWPPLLTTPLE